MNSSTESLLPPKSDENLGECVFQESISFDEPLSETDVRLSIYNGVYTNDKRAIQTSKEYQEWNFQMNSTQEWYIRCSWINKFLFLETLCKSTSGCLVIESVLKCIEPILAKDVVESLSSGCTKFAYDMIPTDDDRSLPPSKLEKLIQKDFAWFKKLEPMRQTSAILRLLRLSGAGLVFAIYKSIAAIYRERRISQFGSFSIGLSQSIKFSVDSRQKIKGSSRSLATKPSSDLKGSDGPKSSSSEFTCKKLELLARREAELTDYKKLKGITGEESPAKKGEIKEVIDYLQIMPIQLNRRIMSHVDEKALSGFKKVGKYWGKMIDESINEKSGRRAINAKINKVIGTNSDQSDERNQEKPKMVEREKYKGEKEEEKEVQEEEEGGGGEGGEDEEDNGELESLVELGRKEFFKNANRSENFLTNSTKAYGQILSKKFQATKLDKTIFAERCCCWDKKVELMASSTTNNFVCFYSMRTGKMLNFSVFGFESPITCLALHEDRTHVIVGCMDGTLKAKAMRTNKNSTNFVGHVQPIKLLRTTSTILLSSSSDNVIRCFQLWSGACLLCIDLSQEFRVSSALLKSDDDPVRCCGAVGTKEGVLILVDAEKKTFLRKVKIHNGEITALASDENLLITAAKNGRIGVWNLTQLEKNSTALNPYYNINAAGSISSLCLHHGQIFLACEDGSVKIVSLANGKIFKTLRMTSQQTGIQGLAIYEDRFSLKLIIWHLGGIEMRSFSLAKLPSNKKSTEKIDGECKERWPARLDRKTKFFQMILAGFTENSGEVIEVMPNAHGTNFLESRKNPLKESDFES